MAAEPKPGSNPYRLTFERYLAQSTRVLIDAISQAPSALDEDVRAQALYTLELALAQPSAWPQAGELMLALAPKVEQAGLREEWIDLLHAGIRTARQQDDRAAEASLTLHLAFLLQLRSAFPAARACLLDLLPRVAGDGAEATALNRLAYVAHLQGNEQEASGWATQAQGHPAASVGDQAQNHFVWGVIDHRRRNWPDAAEHFTAALELWETSQPPQPRMAAWSLLNLGVALRCQQRYAEAATCYGRASELLDGLGDPVHAALARMNLGNLYLLQQDPTAALACYAAAEPVFRRVRDDLRLALVYTNQGLAWRDLGDLTRAERNLRASLDRWQALGSVPDWAEAAGEVATVLVAQQRTAEAAALLDAALAGLAAAGDDPDQATLVAALRAQRAALLIPA